MRHLKVLVMMLCSTYALAKAPETFELEIPVKCGKNTEVFEYFEKEFGEKPSTLLRSDINDSYFTLLVNDKNNTWTLIQFDAKVACILGTGERKKKINM